MKKLIKKILTGFSVVVGLFLLYVLLVLLHGTLTDYRGPAQEAAVELAVPDQPLLQDSVMSFLIWNIGFGGLGEESDFFYDAGRTLYSGDKKIRMPLEWVDKNEAGIQQMIQSNPADFVLLQEVDRDSRRSYHHDQFADIRTSLKDYSAYFGLNYQVGRVPLPFFEPWNVYGKVRSGIATYSRFASPEAVRLQLPGEYAWPTRIFQLDRCLLINRIPLLKGKELVVINVHHSAYDKGGLLKQAQMAFTKALLETEYQKGNYVIAGGDWNQCPPFFPFDSFMPGKNGPYTQLNIDPELLPADWKWMYDPRVPSNRKLADPYEKGETFVTLIDFFVVSPNIKTLKVKTIDTGFQFSDHQPVWMQVLLL